MLRAFFSKPRKAPVVVPARILPKNATSKVRFFDQYMFGAADWDVSINILIFYIHILTYAYMPIYMFIYV